MGVNGRTLQDGRAERVVLDLTFLVLAELTDQTGDGTSDGYCYEIHKRLEERLGEVHLGSVNRILRVAENDHLVVSRTELHRNREIRFYVLTEAGRKEVLRRCARQETIVQATHDAIGRARRSLQPAE